MCLNERPLLDKCVVGFRFLYFLFDHSIHSPERDELSSKGLEYETTILYTRTHTQSYIQYSMVNISHSYLPYPLWENKERPYMAKLCVCVWASTVLYPRFKAGHNKESQNVQTHRRSEQNDLRSPPKNVFQPRGFGKTLRGQINSAENLRPFPAL